ncbi:acyltransferase family protein [Streptosporangium sp. NPDC023615]|uniref:acyltransferase family protein n=1 Tax=Streptosporangium sp. NPDC023615 TaxID=3154794 RepID=UPI0034471FDA
MSAPADVLPVSPADRPATRAETRSERRPEIEGLRAVAVLLVVIYHVWPRRVSGGVDVFLMLTGFLITGSLLRTVERRGRVAFGAFAARLAGRLLPPVALVLLGVLAGTLLWLPRTRWHDTLAEVFASALYYENWHLAAAAVDYLAGGNAAGPVQHFWSLAVQGQFYVIWPVLLALTTVVAARGHRSPRTVFLGVMTLVLAGSLAYSVVWTAADQRWAYFDTGARLWEFALGGVLAVVLPYLRLPRASRVALGWIGLAALVSCGVLLQVSTVFPGYAALWPTVAGAMIIVAGVTGSAFGADRLLTLRPVTYVGSISYALYLWHWPIFIFYLAETGRTAASLKGIVLIVGTSLVLAAATTALTDRIPLGGAGRPAAIGLACLLPVLVIAGVWTSRLDGQVRQEGGGIVPAPAVAARDRPRTYADGCNQVTGRDELLTCRYGATNPARTIVLAGNSHAAHWFPALHAIADANGWQVVNMTKGACALSTRPQRYQGRPYPSCDRWQRDVMAEVRRIEPDLLVTTATISSPFERGETLPAGYVERWRQLGAMGVEVLAIRDTPRMPFDPPECVEVKGAAACVDDERNSLAAVSPAAGLRRPPPNVTFADLTPLLCPRDRCPSVIGDLMVYSDKGHITATFMRSLAPAVEKEIRRALGP